MPEVMYNALEGVTGNSEVLEGAAGKGNGLSKKVTGGRVMMSKETYEALKGVIDNASGGMKGDTSERMSGSGNERLSEGLKGKEELGKGKSSHKGVNCTGDGEGTGVGKSWKTTS